MITLPVELYSSKNSRRILRAGDKIIVAKSKVAKEQEYSLTEIMYYLISQWRQEMTGAEYPLKLGIYIYRKTRRRWDWVNICQNLFDCMVKAGWLPDDDVEHLTPVFLGWSVDKTNPRVEITVL